MQVNMPTIVPWNLCKNDAFELTAIVAKQRRACHCGPLTSHILPYKQLIEDIDYYDDYVTTCSKTVDTHELKELPFFQTLSREQKLRFSAGLFNDQLDNSILLRQNAPTDGELVGCLFCKIITRSMWIIMIGERQPFFAPCHINIHCAMTCRPVNYKFKKDFTLVSLFDPSGMEGLKRKIKSVDHVHQVDQIKYCTKKNHGGIGKTSRTEKRINVEPLRECSRKDKEHRTMAKNVFHRNTTHAKMVLSEEGAHHCPGVNHFTSCFKQCLIEYLNNPEGTQKIVGMKVAPDTPETKIRVALRIFKQLMHLLCTQTILKEEGRMIRLYNFWEHVLTSFYPMTEQKEADTAFLATIQ